MADVIDPRVVWSDLQNRVTQLDTMFEQNELTGSITVVWHYDRGQRKKQEVQFREVTPVAPGPPVPAPTDPGA